MKTTLLAFAIGLAFALIPGTGSAPAGTEPAPSPSVSAQDVQALAAQYYDEAVKAYEAGQLGPARHQLRAALKLEPTFAKAKSLLALVEKKLNIPPSVLVSEKLGTHIPTVEFEKAPLKEVVDFLAREADVNIVFDASALQLLGPGGPEPTGTVQLAQEGPARIQPEEGELPSLAPPEVALPPSEPRRDLITIHLRDVPLREVLKYVLRFKGLKYIVEDYAILIVPLDWAEGEMETDIFRLTTGDTGARQIQEHLAGSTDLRGSQSH
jgi:hypothetical protein